MASPIAHSFAGFWTSLVFVSRSPFPLVECWRRYWPRLLVLIGVANLPDLDFLFDLAGDPNALHRGFTHSLLAALLFSLGLGLVWRIAQGFWKSFLLYFAAYASHLLIDSITGMRLGWTHSGSGIPLFWPWPQAFSSPLCLIFGVRHGNLAALFSIDNLLSATYELVTLGVMTTLLLAIWNRKTTARTNVPNPEVATPFHAELQHHK